MGEYVGKVLKGDNLRYAGFRGGVPQSEIWINIDELGDERSAFHSPLATEFEIWINMKTAKTLGLNVPRSLLQCAKGVIE